MQTLFIVTFLVFCFFLNVFLHEMSHALASIILFRAKIKKLRLFPSISSGKLVFGYIELFLPSYVVAAENRGKLALTYFAPRFLNIICAILFPVSAAFGFSAWTQILIASNLIDLLWGSVGLHEFSDIQMYSKLSGFNIWHTRIIQFGIAFFSIFLSIGIGML